MEGVHIIAIAGLSCSGKSSLAQAISRLSGCPVLSLDDYYRPLAQLPREQRTKLNYDAPEMLDHDLLYRHVAALADGRPAEIPTYDFVEFTRREEQRRLEPAPLIVLEGQYALYWSAIADLCSTRVFLDVAPDDCLARRLDRDIRERGRTSQEVHWRFENHVLPMFHAHMAPSRAHATRILRAPYDVDAEAARLLDHIALAERVSLG